jgi:hypothetical protein
MALVQIGGEQISVGTAAIGPTTAEVTSEVHMAEFEHLSGGAIFMQTQEDPTAGGTNGDFPAEPGRRWRIWGHDEVLSFRMIRQGGVSGVVAAQYFGTGKT